VGAGAHARGASLRLRGDALTNPESRPKTACEARAEGAKDHGIRRKTALGQTHASDEPFLLTYPNLSNPLGEVLLRNERVVIQRFVVGPGEWEGIHSHPGNQLCIHIRGGEWSGRERGRGTYSGSVCDDGEVEWLGEPVPLRVGHESGNTGETPIEIVWVTLKEASPSVRTAEPLTLRSPNAPVELVLENDRVIVQRVRIDPGHWEGVHPQSGDQIVVHITEGTRSNWRDGVAVDAQTRVEAGSVEWWDRAEDFEGLVSGNSSHATSDQIWITLK
jgi:hypothetical protein